MLCTLIRQKSWHACFQYLYLLHQVSDKRLLWNCGKGRSYLVVAEVISNLSSGRHNGKAEVWTTNWRVNVQSVIKRKVQSSLQIESSGRSDLNLGLNCQTAQFWTGNRDKLIIGCIFRKEKLMMLKDASFSSTSGMPNGQLKGIAVESLTIKWGQKKIRKNYLKPAKITVTWRRKQLRLLPVNGNHS